MSLSSDEILRLLEVGREAAVVVREDRVYGMNMPAEQLFAGKLRVSVPAAEIFPAELLENPAERFSGACKLLGVDCELSALRLGDSLVLVIAPAEEKQSALIRLSDNLMEGLHSAMGTLRMAADQLILRKKPMEPDKRRAYAGAFYQNYYQLLRLTGNLTALGGLLAGSYPLVPRLEDLYTLCEDAVSSARPLLPQPGPRLVFEAGPGDYLLHVDRNLVERMLLNLIANSLEHTGPEGEVRVSLKRTAAGVILAVDDNGEGMAQETYAHVLRAYEREPGDLSDLNAAGLGLSIVSGIARLHGGTMVLESREGKGTSVRVTLPERTDLPDKFRSTLMPYRDTGMQMILTELSGLLPGEVYSEKFFD